MNAHEDPQTDESNQTPSTDSGSQVECLVAAESIHTQFHNREIVWVTRLDPSKFDSRQELVREAAARAAARTPLRTDDLIDSEFKVYTIDSSHFTEIPEDTDTHPTPTAAGGN